MAYLCFCGGALTPPLLSVHASPLLSVLLLKMRSRWGSMRAKNCSYCCSDSRLVQSSRKQEPGVSARTVLAWWQPHTAQAQRMHDGGEQRKQDNTHRHSGTAQAQWWLLWGTQEAAQYTRGWGLHKADGEKLPPKLKRAPGLVGGKLWSD